MCPVLIPQPHPIPENSFLPSEPSFGLLTSPQGPSLLSSQEGPASPLGPQGLPAAPAAPPSGPGEGAGGKSEGSGTSKGQEALMCSSSG